MEKIKKSDEEWKKALTDEQFQVARKKGTEQAFTGEYWDNHEKGMYRCACCGNELFSSDTKFESGTASLPVSRWDRLPTSVVAMACIDSWWTLVSEVPRC